MGAYLSEPLFPEFSGIICNDIPGLLWQGVDGRFQNMLVGGPEAGMVRTHGGCKVNGGFLEGIIQNRSGIGLDQIDGGIPLVAFAPAGWGTRGGC
jgi:hypothetical protein